MPQTVQGNKIIDKINERIKRKEPFFSFEYFPPKTEQGVKNLDARMTTMAERGPVWMDMTWGAGGRTSDLTLSLCDKIQNEKKVDALMHLTCTNMEKKKIDDALAGCKDCGVRNILALRGDPPQGEERWTASEGGFSCALDLIKHIRKTQGSHFCVSCAGYPEGHPNVRKEITDPKWDPKTNTPKYWAVHKVKEGKWEGVSPEDWKTEQNYLKQKVDAGAEFIVTQLFYDLPIFYEWVKQCRAIGITVPILPGIMPFFKAPSFIRMTGFCKTVVPQAVLDKVEQFKEDVEGFRKWGVQYLTEMSRDLLASGLVPSIHLYTLNNQKIPYQILDSLGFPKTKGEKPALYSTFSLDLGSKSTNKNWHSGFEGKDKKENKSAILSEVVSKGSKVLRDSGNGIRESPAISSRTQLLGDISQAKRGSLTPVRKPREGLSYAEKAAYKKAMAEKKKNKA